MSAIPQLPDSASLLTKNRPPPRTGVGQKSSAAELTGSPRFCGGPQGAFVLSRRATQTSSRPRPPGRFEAMYRLRPSGDRIGQPSRNGVFSSQLLPPIWSIFSAGGPAPKNGPPPAPRGHKAWGLLAYLVRARVPPSRERLAGLLFPEADDPLGALRWTLSVLRRQLGEHAELGGDPVVLTLPPGTFVDVDVLSRGSWMEAVALPGFGHELLDGLAFRSSPGFELWLESERRPIQGTP